MTLEDFASHFGISSMSYYKWRRAVFNDKRVPKFDLANVQKGLDSLGYEMHVVIPKRKLK